MNVDLFFANRKVWRLLEEMGEKPVSAVIAAAVARGGIQYEEAFRIAEALMNNELTVQEVEMVAKRLEKFSQLEEGKRKEIAKAVEWRVLDAIERRGKEWMIAAMVEGSAGYHTPKHALQLIDDFLNGIRESWCERCLACYDTRLDLMIFHDVVAFESLERIQPEKARKITEFVKKAMELSDIEQLQLGLAYPTMVF